MGWLETLRDFSLRTAHEGGMRDFVKEIRYPVSALFLLVLATGWTLFQQDRFKDAILRVEEFAIARHLAELKPNEIEFYGGIDFIPQSQDDQLEPERAEREAFNEARQKFAKFGAIEVMGQANISCQGECEYRTPIFGSDILKLMTPATKDQGFQEKLKSHNESRAAYEARKNVPQQKQAKRPPAKKKAATKTGAPSEQGPRRELFYLEVKVTGSLGETTQASRHDFVFTNVVTKYDEAELDEIYAEPGSILVYYRDGQRTGWEGPETSGSLLSAALQTARNFGVVATKIEDAYRDLKIKYEQKEINLPVIGLSVNRDSLMVFSFALSIGLAAWMSFLLRSIRNAAQDREEDPELLAEPFSQFGRVAVWEKPVAAIELTLFVGLHTVAILAPMVIWVEMVKYGPVTSVWIAVATFVLAVLFSGSMLRNYVVIVRRAIALGRKKPR